MMIKMTYSILSKGKSDEDYLEKILSFRGGRSLGDVVLIPFQYVQEVLDISKKRDWGMYKIDPRAEEKIKEYVV